MPEKKEQNKFTIQFNIADPSHRQIVDILNQQGRRKAQFIVNAVQHYLHCSETPEIPQAAPADIQLIEKIVQQILEKQQGLPQRETLPAPKPVPVETSENLSFNDEVVDMLGANGLEAISNTMAMFRKG